jgi:hypothetical protein
VVDDLPERSEEALGVVDEEFAVLDEEVVEGQRLAPCQPVRCSSWGPVRCPFSEPVRCRFSELARCWSAEAVPVQPGAVLAGPRLSASSEELRTSLRWAAHLLAVPWPWVEPRPLARLQLSAATKGELRVPCLSLHKAYADSGQCFSVDNSDVLALH